MTDLEAALEPVREILARRDVARRNGTAAPAPTGTAAPAPTGTAAPAPTGTAVPAAAPPAHVNGAASRSSIDWELFDQNLADVRKVVERLRNGAH